jgi:hypothetical protein
MHGGIWSNTHTDLVGIHHLMKFKVAFLVVVFLKLVLFADNMHDAEAIQALSDSHFIITGLYIAVM